MAELKRRGIIFDFDDTLVYFHEQFLLAEQAFIATMKELALYDDDLLISLGNQDIINIRKAGYLAAKCFPLAITQTYENYCRKYCRLPKAQELSMLSQLGWQPYLKQPREMEGAQQLIEHLRSLEYSDRLLILYTQGEAEIQQKRIVSCAFTSKFDIIKIVGEKNDANLQALLMDNNLQPSLTWYIGNSLRADINPAIRAGLKAVHIRKNGWSYEEEEPYGFYYSISHLDQFADLLKKEEV
ncbi:MAG: HAD family hydrolase [Firmicutes bacterium]|nr:HAD family hydrolase [Bacillota bacterium]